MKTQGEIEAAISDGMSRFEQEYMGRGPKDIHTHLIDGIVVVRLQGVLTAAEQHLVKSLANDKGRELLKQVRTQSCSAQQVLMSVAVCWSADVADEGQMRHNMSRLRPGP